MSKHTANKWWRSRPTYSVSSFRSAIWCEKVCPKSWYSYNPFIGNILATLRIFAFVSFILEYLVNFENIRILSRLQVSKIRKLLIKFSDLGFSNTFSAVNSEIFSDSINFFGKKKSSNILDVSKFYVNALDLQTWTSRLGEILLKNSKFWYGVPRL